VWLYTDMALEVIEGDGKGKKVFGSGKIIERTADGTYRVKYTLHGAVLFVSMTLLLIRGGLS
jgi:hypothetical protein